MRRPDWWIKDASVNQDPSGLHIKTIPEICLALHSVNIGTCDDWNTGEKERRLLEWCVANWEPSMHNTNAFDDAVLNLVEVVLAEKPKYEAKK